jgi:hypothetical protein
VDVTGTATVNKIVTAPDSAVVQLLYPHSLDGEERFGVLRGRGAGVRFVRNEREAKTRVNGKSCLLRKK